MMCVRSMCVCFLCFCVGPRRLLQSAMSEAVLGVCDNARGRSWVISSGRALRRVMLSCSVR
jgi:hypothetical protein